MECMRLWFLSVLLVICTCPYLESSVSIVTASLPNGVVDDPYFAVVNTESGCTPFTWSVTGSLPIGVQESESANTTALKLTGIPTTPGTYRFTVSVTGCGGHMSTASYKVTIQRTSDHVVDLSWIPSTSNDLAGYNVYRSPDGNRWRKINLNPIASTQYSDSTVADESTYYYAATAVNIAGVESSLTNPIVVEVP